MSFSTQPIGIFNKFSDADLEKYLCGEVYTEYDGRDGAFKARCTHLKGHAEGHGWIADREFRDLERMAGR